MKMKLSQLLALSPVALATLVPIEAKAAAVDYFLKLDGVEGESADKAHPKEIVLDSFSFGVSTPVGNGAGGGGAGKPSFSDLSATAKLSKVSPTLYLASASGQHLKSALISVRKSGGKDLTDFYTVKLEDVVITSLKTGGTTAELPGESVTLNFSKVTWSYKTQKADGSYDATITKSWDLKLGKGN